MDTHQWFLITGSGLIIVVCVIIWMTSGASAYYDKDNPKSKEWRLWHWTTGLGLVLILIAGLAFVVIIQVTSHHHSKPAIVHQAGSRR